MKKRLSDMYPDSVRERAEFEYGGIFVEGAAMSEDMRRLTLTLSAARPLTSRELERIEQELLDYYMLDDVEITAQEEGRAPAGTAEQLAAFAPKLCERFDERCPVCRGYLKDCALSHEDGVVTVALAHGGYLALCRSGAGEHISDILKEELGVAAQIVFDGVLKAGAENSVTAARREKLAQAPQNPGEKKRKSPVIFGNNTKDKPERIADITMDSGRVCLEGEILGVESRASRDGRSTRIFFPVTDYTSTVTVKLFVSDEKPDKLLSRLTAGAYIRVRGDARYDKYDGEVSVTARDIVEVEREGRTDAAPEKRVELHLHTNMSALDAITPAASYVERAASWGHNAIAITDHGVIQAFPEAYAAAKKHNIKVLYGIESYFVSDDGGAAGEELPLDGEFVVFDVETTGLYSAGDRLTEIGAVRVKAGKIVDSFDTFVDPERPIPAEITGLTGITDAMVKGAPKEAEAVKAFLVFAGGAPLAAHNARFDLSFIRAVSLRHGFACPVDAIDTVALARRALPTLKNHKLDTVASHFSLEFRHHRACDDAAVTGEILLRLMQMGAERGAQCVSDLDTVFGEREDIRRGKAWHQIILVKTQAGLKNLFKLVSASNLRYFGGKSPRIPKSELVRRREGLLVGSACEAGELFTAALEGKSDAELDEIAAFYDYLEIQPICNNRFLVEQGRAEDDEELRGLNRRIVACGERTGKPVVATCDAHFLDPHEEQYRRILLAGQGYADADRPLPLYFRTTEEMLEEFAYLGEEKAREVVITNPNLIAGLCETVIPIKDRMYPPNIEGAEENLRKFSYERAAEIYGDPLPKVVADRLERELTPIINNGFAVMYMTARALVQKSESDGYLVGSRGSVGSSLVAYFAGITEVNSLPPHYICTECRHTEFDLTGIYEAGCDMPDAVCPVCGAPCRKEGFDIPFETFLGFKGEKVPDIDLNFSGVYQSRAHQYTEELFGVGHVFRAGTIATVGDKNAYGYVKRYLESHGEAKPRPEENRLIAGFTNVKRTTGQHPGGVMIVPSDMEIEDFTPVQHPADKSEKDIITTHFDYHAIHDNILKLDLLGHDDPTVLRMLGDLTGIDVRTLPLMDPKVMSLFSSTEALEPLTGDIGKTGAIALPEFGTHFVRGMLEETRPTTFGELVRISGLSHGTDVWLGNAETLIKDGTCTLRECICIRDDIMLYLMRTGMPPEDSFNITERVRKGKGLTDKQEALMRTYKVPQWYIESCKKIAYMFPKAHAVAYVTSAMRIAWFKVYRPLEFYATYFTVRADDFDAETMTGGRAKLEALIRSTAKQEATAKDEKTATIAEVALEMAARGFEFLPVDVYRSAATDFTIEDGKLRAPLNALPGVGKNAALAIVKAREPGEFLSREELCQRAGVSVAVADTLSRNGALGDMPESAQISFFL
ncbi:MAG TPA: PolC-type DNA polymerase III [Candidatus Acidoferrum sp.]|nr:PolC-type DNA polymerase III [Candidatus Acidoferrum sp.]